MADRRTGHGRPGKPANGHGVANLVGGGPSLVGPIGAMRARDVSRPSEGDYARAQKTVVVRRRPPDQPAAMPAVPPVAATEDPGAAAADPVADVGADAGADAGAVEGQSSAGASDPVDS